MTPAELKAWLIKHGSADGTPESNSTRSMVGQDIIFAKDGSKVVLTRLTPDSYRIDDILEKDDQGNVVPSEPTGGEPASSTPAPEASTEAPATPAPAGSGAVSQDQLGQMLQQQAPGGNVSGWDHSSQVVTRTVPPKYPGMPSTQARVPVEQWINRQTGYTITAEVQPGGGSYVVTDNGVKPENKTPANQNASAAPPTEKDQNGRHFVWKPNPGGPSAGGQWEDVGPAESVSAEQPVNGRPGWVQVTTKQGNNTTTKFRGPDGKEVSTLPGESGTTRAPVEGHPGVFLVTSTAATGNGTNKESHYENAAGQTISAPPDKEEIRKGPDGEDVRVVRDPQTGQVLRYEPITGAQTKPPPSEVGNFQPDINKPALGIVEYAQKVYALLAAKKITEQQKNDALTYAHQAATTEASRLDNIRASQAQQQTNAINQRNADQNASISRGQMANTATQNAFDTSSKLASSMTSKNYTPGLMQAILGLQDQRQQQWGGLDRPPQVTDQNYPMLQGMNQMGMPGQTPTHSDVANQTANTMQNSQQAFQAAQGGQQPQSSGGQPDAGGQPQPDPAAQQQAMQGQSMGPIGPANLFPSPQQGMQIQHPAVDGAMGQAPPGVDPQTWQAMVEQAARESGYMM